MKKFILVLLALSSISAYAAGPKKFISCDTNSDPDFVRIDLYEQDGQIIGELSEETGDGDEYAIDHVAFEEVDTGNDSTRTFKQVEGTPKLKGSKIKPSGKSEGVILHVRRHLGDLASSIQADADAFGEMMSRLPMDCVPVRK